MTTESIGRRLVEQLAAGEGGGLEDGAVRVEADVEGASAYGCGLRGLVVAAPVVRAPTAVAEALRSLPEPLDLFEHTPERAILRTPRDRVQGRRYTEVVVTPGQVELARWQGASGGRARLTDPVGHRALEATVDGIVEALTAEERDEP